jgi:hypothetical protein
MLQTHHNWLALSNFHDGASSRLLRVTRTGRPATFRAYDALGSPAATAVDVNGNGVIDYSGPDRVSSSATRHAQINGEWWRVTSHSVWHGNGTDTCLTTGVSRVRLTGLGGWDGAYGGNLTAQSETLDARGNVTRSSTYTDADALFSRVVVESPASVQPALTCSVAGLS